MKVFISWSGEVSQRIGGLVGKWLERTLLNIQAVYTPEYLRAGTQGTARLYDLLEEVHTGIMIYTPESIYSQWMIFEAGALYKSAERSIIIPLLFNLSYQQLPGPLQAYQWKTYGKRQLLEVLLSINEQLGKQKVDKERLSYVFEREWPQLHESVSEALLELTTTPLSVEQKTQQLLQDNQQLRDQNKRLREQVQLLHTRRKNTPTPTRAKTPKVPKKTEPSSTMLAAEALRQKRQLDSRLYALEQRLNVRPRLFCLRLLGYDLIRMTLFGWTSTIILLVIMISGLYILINESISLVDQQSYSVSITLSGLLWGVCLFIDFAQRTHTVHLQVEKEALVTQKAQLEQSFELKVGEKV